MFPTCNKFRKTRNLVNFFIVSNFVLEMAIYLFAHFLFYSHPSFVDRTAWNRWGSVIPILTLMYLNINGKKNNIWLIIIIISHTLPVRITLDCDSKRKLESKTKRSYNKVAITLISLVSTLKTWPNFNFRFRDVEGFDAHCFFMKLIVSKILSRPHHYRYPSSYDQYTFFRSFIYSFIFFS